MITTKQKRKEYIRSLPIFMRVLVTLYVVQIEYTESGAQKGRHIRRERLRPYNPVTYLYVVVVMALMAVNGVVDVARTAYEEMKWTNTYD